MIPKNYPKPANWQDFQIFIKDLLNEKYEKGFDIYGRNGQAQDGIDILGRFNNNTFGTQCKRLDIDLTLKLIKDEIVKTDKSDLKLSRYIFATTCPRDKNIQKEIIEFNTKRRNNSLFEIELWFWETIEDEINGNLNIQTKYYENIFSKIDPKYKELHILDAIRTGFHRPAFLTPFHLENSNNDFFQAIKDTQEFLNTGKLKNRNGEYFAGSLPYKWLTNPDDIRDMDYVVELLQQIRDYITNGIKEGRIITCERKEDCFCFRDGGKSEIKLDELRRSLLLYLNRVFTRNDMREISIRF
ncbi:hypothetical protein EZS27_021893 [termite gut metagenome]|uniref:Mrr-like domain-containing protein n=1 Tax=termite gut metagenome TaxID=433724 RepID=A0A5J4R6H0_9ZZZZ